jgi:hypothetical protein
MLCPRLEDGSLGSLAASYLVVARRNERSSEGGVRSNAPDGVARSESDPLRHRAVLLLRLGKLLLGTERLVALERNIAGQHHRHHNFIVSAPPSRVSRIEAACIKTLNQMNRAAICRFET